MVAVVMVGVDWAAKAVAGGWARVAPRWAVAVVTLAAAAGAKVGVEVAEMVAVKVEGKLAAKVVMVVVKGRRAVIEL